MDLPISEDVNAFVSACETLLEAAIMQKAFNEFETRAIQYYLSAMVAKFPVVI
jgi:hypothetical protein